MPRMMRLLGMVGLVLGMVLIGSTSPAEAATQVADCTFATLQADLQAGGDWYYAPGQCSSPIIFTSTINIGANASLTAQGNDIVLDGGHTGTAPGVQLFSISSGVTVGLAGLTLQHGSTTSSGGAIYNNGTVTISNSTLSGNSAPSTAGGAIGAGGAIYNNGGTMSITDSTLSDNSTSVNFGGAIYNFEGRLTISTSTLSSNFTSGDSADGGAIYNLEGTVTITTSTLSGNSTLGSSADDGAISNNTGTVTISNSTVSSNSSGSGGGVIGNRGTLTITNSTLSGNSGGALGYGSSLITNSSGTLTIGGSIIANSTGANCGINRGLTITDQGYNLEDTSPSTCGFSSANHDLIGVNPQLGPLANNGGPTQTMALQSTSPAIDVIPTTATFAGTSTPICPATDQRGMTRPDWSSEATCDMGAYEFQDPTPAPVISFSTGWNLIDVPLQNTGITSMADLISNLDDPSQLGPGAVKVAATYVTGRFRIYVPGFSADTLLQPSQGIFLLSSVPGRWAPSGNVYPSGQPVNLTPGWNLVAAPFPATGLTASGIATEAGNCGVQEIAVYRNGTYQTWSAGGADISIPATSGFWVLCTSPFTWTPS